MRDLDSKSISEAVPIDVTKPSGLLLLIVCPWSAVRLAATQASAMTSVSTWIFGVAGGRPVP
jgi:hypothetical protein